MRTRRKTTSNLVKDLVALHFPSMAARLAARQVADLARRIAAGEMTVDAARAELRGEA